ncbi:MAG: hypothetical protein J3R72DRAFT_448239 [Linnemannia gamsii]|nr:MAG: hypothetical protein J3R72DRAFT_448239 [Linnemannia gamsii]
MLSFIQPDHAPADVMVPPPCAGMRQWDFNHLPLADQLQALGEDATPPSYSSVYFFNKWSRELPDAPCLLVPNATATAYITFSYMQYNVATNVIARYWASKLNPAWLDVGRTRAMAALDAPVALLVKDLPTSHFLIIAFHKLRIPVLLISPRNSPAGVSHLVTTGKVSAILIEDGLRSLLEPQVAHIPTYSVPLVNPDELLRAPVVPPVPHCTDVDAEDIAIIVHSSGTTGFPKLLPTPHRAMYFSGLWFALTDRYYARRKRSSALMVLPLFHAYGARAMISTVIGGQALVLPLTTTWPVSAAQTAASLKQSKATILYTVPAIIEQLVSNTSMYEALSGLRTLYYAGAPLSVETVQLLRDQIGIRLTNVYGSSEGGLVLLGCVEASHGDSDSRGDEMTLGPLTHAYMEDVEKDLYELVIHRDSIMAGHMQTDEQGWYRSGDLFQHRGNEHYVLIGRKDDTLVHTNGEKTLAQPMENTLIGFEPVILRALVVGSNRPCTAALIELDPEVAALLSQEEINTRIANAFAQANVTAPQHSHLLYPDMVTVLPLGGPSLLTTDKGTVRRRPCMELFAHKIDALYNALDDSQASSQPLTLSTAIAKCSASELEQKLRELLTQFLPKGSADLLKTNDEWRQLDFFSNLGIDSLQATHARGRIAKSFGFRLSAESIFTYSTIEQLAKWMIKQNDGMAVATTSQVVSDASVTEAQNNRTLEYIRKFTDFSDLIVHPKGDVISHETEAGVLLTGATGSLGAWVLDALVQRPVDRVKTVFVLVRGGADKAIERVRESLRQRHCNVAAFDAALAAMHVVVLGNYNTNDVMFGQTIEVYKQLEQEVSVIMHVAWSVGFNKPVQAYADQMFNVAQFARLAAVPAIRSSSQLKRIVFTSSVSVALAYPAVSGGSYNVPEDELDIQAASAVAGYSRSKFAAESILMEAYRQLGVPAKVVRVGQIAGDREHGVWTNATEMNALLTYAPTTVHALPSSGVSRIVDWVPVDDVARTLLEFALDTPRTASVYNLVNPKSISWSEFVDILRRALPTTNFDVQPYSKWVEGLSKDLNSGESEEDIKKRNPFFELIPFLQQSVGNGCADVDDKVLVFMTDSAQRDSSVIRSLPAIDDALVRKYLRGWQRVGLIDSQVEIAE